jgi:hypothetical protein
MRGSGPFLLAYFSEWFQVSLPVLVGMGCSVNVGNSPMIHVTDQFLPTPRDLV